MPAGGVLEPQLQGVDGCVDSQTSGAGSSEILWLGATLSDYASGVTDYTSARTVESVEVEALHAACFDHDVGEWDWFGQVDAHVSAGSADERTGRSSAGLTWPGMAELTRSSSTRLWPRHVGGGVSPVGWLRWRPALLEMPAASGCTLTSTVICTASISMPAVSRQPTLG